MAILKISPLFLTWRHAPFVLHHTLFNQIIYNFTFWMHVASDYWCIVLFLSSLFTRFTLNHAGQSVSHSAPIRSRSKVGILARRSVVGEFVHHSCPQYKEDMVVMTVHI